MEYLLTSLSLHLLPVKLGAESDLACKSLPVFIFYVSKQGITQPSVKTKREVKARWGEQRTNRITFEMPQEMSLKEMTFAQTEGSERVNMWISGLRGV